MKINYKLQQGLELKRHGSMIDLYSTENVELKINEAKLIDLGFSLELPKYIKALIYPRSGLYKHCKCILANSVGIIDPPGKNRIEGVEAPKIFRGYIGNGDVWKANLLRLEVDQNGDTVNIPKGTRLLQFELQPVMDIPFWNILKWLFKSKIKFNRVEVFKSSENRGGFGSTGNK